jgi:hypothetical protein
VFLEAGDLSSHQITTPTALAINSDYHTFRLEVVGSSLRFLIDGNLVVSATNTQFSSPGRVGLWSWQYPIEIRKFRVLSQ